MKVGALCAGYGGIELGLTLAEVDVDLRWYAESNSRLTSLWPADVRNLGDIRMVDWSTVERVDMLTAGFPCQPVSAAGAQLAQADSRWLWPDVLRAITALSPNQVLIENVRNLISIQKGQIWQGILADLARSGYDVRWLTLGACHVGAAHHRHRVFALATHVRTLPDGWLGPLPARRIATTPCGAHGASFLPTPTARDGDGRGVGDRHYWSHRRLSRSNGLPLDATVALLPTPRATDGSNGGPGQRGARGDLAMSSAVQLEHFGQFTTAVERHAAIYGEPPPPTERNRNGNPRLSPTFAEWLMCLPVGHVSNRLLRVDALRAIGDGVCPPQLAAAYRLLTDLDAPLDASLDLRVASQPMTDVQGLDSELQDRDKIWRKRVIAAASDISPDIDLRIAAAMMELVAVWREDAVWWDNSGRKGKVAAAKELRIAATRLAGFAINLVDPVVATAVDPAGPVMATEAEIEVEAAKIVAELSTPVDGPVDNPQPTNGAIMDFLTGRTDTYVTTGLIDNPFSSPLTPGQDKRPEGPSVRIPYAALPLLTARIPQRDHVSHSHVSSYEQCPLACALNEANKAGLVGARRPSWSLIGGSTFHAAIEDYERSILAGDVDPRQPWNGGDYQRAWDMFLDAVIRSTMDNANGTRYADSSTWHVANGGREGFDWWRIEGANMLRGYITHHDATWHETRSPLKINGLAAIEYPYEMTVRTPDGAKGLTAKGFVDIAWHNVGTGIITIVDYKTGRSAPAETFQLGEYAHALDMALRAGNAQPFQIFGSYWLARKGEYTAPIDALAAHPLEELQYRYSQADHGFAAGVFPPRPSNLCVSCSMVDYCPTRR